MFISLLPCVSVSFMHSFIYMSTSENLFDLPISALGSFGNIHKMEPVGAVCILLLSVRPQRKNAFEEQLTFYT